MVPKRVLRKKSTGMILIWTLCLLAIIFLLLISTWSSFLLLAKAFNHQELSHRQRYQLEYLIGQLAAQDILNQQQCLSSSKGANQIIHQLIHHQGCLLTVNAINYRYFVEDLGVFPCLVTPKGQKNWATQHVRISLLRLSRKHTSAALLQVRLIKSVSTAVDQSTCTTLHKIRSGVSSWRYLTNLSFLNLN